MGVAGRSNPPSAETSEQPNVFQLLYPRLVVWINRSLRLVRILQWGNCVVMRFETRQRKAALGSGKIYHTVSEKGTIS